MAWAYLLLSLLAVCAPAFFRYVGAGLEFAAPIRLSPTAWVLGIGGIAATAVVAVVSNTTRLRDATVRQALLELLLLPAAFVYEWWRLPARTRDYTPINWTVLVILLGAIGMLIWRDRFRGGAPGLGLRGFAGAMRRLALPTAAMVLVPVAVGLAMGVEVSASGVAVSLATYPFYALVQLLVFQVFLVPRLRLLSTGPGTVVVVAAGLFALLHWPNAVLMGACGVAAGIWTWTYLERPNVYALAISMALSATALVQCVPDHLTHHARVGPIYVLRLRDRSTLRSRRKVSRTMPAASQRTSDETNAQESASAVSAAAGASDSPPLAEFGQTSPVSVE